MSPQSSSFSFSIVRNEHLKNKLKKHDRQLSGSEYKQQQAFSSVEFFAWQEGLCVQCMHISSYNDAPVTVAVMSQYAKVQGYEADFNRDRFHHEIYLSDVRRCKPERLKT